MKTFQYLLFVVCIGYGACSSTWHDDSWPPDSNKPCTQGTKQKAMYAKMTFDPPISSSNPINEMQIKVKLNDLQFAPHNTRKSGGFYMAYTTGIHDGPGGYLGVQMSANGGQFLFSIWDADRWIGRGSNKKPKPSNKITWPMNMERCNRNYQDCGMAHLVQWRKRGLTTGTQCKLPYPEMKKGDRYLVKLQRVKKQQTIKTTDFGEMPISHLKFDEVDREITGGVWVVTVEDLRRKKLMEIGKIMFEGDGRGMNRLGTFDEMLGCNKCNAIYHKNTRFGPTIVFEDGKIRKPKKMEGRTKAPISTCKGYAISGKIRSKSITFEGGPLTQVNFPEDGNNHLIWEI